MRTLVFFLGLVALALPASAFEKYARKTYAVKPDCTLKIDTYRGSIEVEESEEPEIRINIRIGVANAKDQAEADRILEALHLESKQEGNVVMITATNPSETRVRFTWNDKNLIDLAYSISVPKQCNVDLISRDGSVTVANLDGKHTARTTKGTIYFRRTEGSVTAIAQEGDIIVSRCSGDLMATTTRGVVRIGWVGGKAKLRNSSGDVEIQNAVGGLDAHCEAGDATVGFPKEITGDAKVSTNGGSIFARIDPDAHCAVDASSSPLGHVDCTLPMTVESSSRTGLSAKLNGGGAKISLSASGGHVKIDSAAVAIE